MDGNDSSVCRICFDSNSANSPLISPCNCKGSSQYIHENCLIQWIASQSINHLKRTCEICKADYRLSYSHSNKSSIWHKAIKYPQLSCSLCFTVLLFIMSTVSFAVFLENHAISPKINVGSFVFAVFVFSFCFLCFMCIGYRLVKKIFCFKREISYQVVPANFSDSENSIGNFSVSLFRSEPGDENVE